MDVDRGSIQVAPGETTRVEVEVIRKPKGLTGPAAEEVLAAHQITFSAEGNKVQIHAQFSKDSRVSSRDKSRLQVRYKVLVPKQFNLALRTAGGEITTGDLEGEVVASSNGGALKFGNIQGEVHASTSGGAVKLAGATSTVTVKTAGGNIDLGNLGGDSTAKTAGGSIAVGQSKGKLLIETSGGNIDIRDAQSTVKAKTAGGSISANFSAQPEDASYLISAAGNIRVKLSPDLSVDLDAKTAGGKVTTDLELGELDRGKGSSLRGTLNKGGHKLDLKTGGGNISIGKL
jgi:DUF4097 and DUF4098 domain-containing protein YvlB